MCFYGLRIFNASAKVSWTVWLWCLECFCSLEAFSYVSGVGGFERVRGLVSGYGFRDF